MDDIFDEEPVPVKTVRAGNRFQPKGKKASVRSTSTTTLIDDGKKQKAVSQPSDVEHPVQPVADAGEMGKKTVDDLPVSVPLQVSGVKEDVIHSEKVSGENAGMFQDFSYLDNVTTDSAHKGEKDAGDSVDTLAQSLSLPIVHDGAQEDISPDLFTTEDQENCNGAAVFNNDGGTSFDNRMLETQHGEAFLGTDTGDFVSNKTAASGGRAAKYKPKPRVRFETEKPSDDLPRSEAFESESVMHPPNSQFASSEDAFFSSDYDYSSIDLGDISPSDPTTSELPVNDEQSNFPETNHSDITTLGGKHQMNERQPEKQMHVPERLGDCDDEACDGSFNAEPPDEDDSHVNGLEGESKNKKKAPRKSKKALKEKSGQKRKNTNEDLDVSTEAGPKKFPHTTRRKRRIVNQELLQTPEDEIDPRKVPMRDLIRLAEYKERLAIKEAKTSAAATTQSTENHGQNEYDAEQTFASEQGDGSAGGDQGIDGSNSGPILYNYHSFMRNKTRTIRWSKQETDVFYEAIHKFGTDLSTIQQLFFPERSRHQVKLKYKKEEREHPLKLTEALTSRVKDHSHYEKAIEQLKKAAAQAEQDTYGDDSMGMTGEEEAEDLTTEVNQGEVPKNEETREEQGADVAEIQSPPKDESEDTGIDYFDLYDCTY